MKWEYKTVQYQGSGWFHTKVNSEEVDKELNQLGAAGWELAATLHPTSGGDVNLLIFKREKAG